MGGWISVGCGLHCAVLGWVGVSLPGAWLSRSWLGVPAEAWLTVERILLCLTLLVAAGSAVLAYRSGRCLRGTLLLATGCAGLVMLFVNSMHRVPVWGSVAVLACAAIAGSGHLLQLKDSEPRS
jgi:hypothetical protein